MLINVLDLETMTVNDIMIPRNELIGLNLDEDNDTLLEIIISSGYTRLPVYKGDINNVVGILHMKRVNRLLRKGSEKLTKEAIKRFALEPYFIPEGTPLHKQLINFRNARRRIGLVVDEYGEILGLVTLEDLLEEIVGDFTTNQSASSDEEIIREDKHRYLIDGAATIREINKATGWELPIDGPKTLNGLALEQLENIPDGNVSFILGSYRFETVALTEKMIDKTRITRVLMHSSRVDEPEEDI